MAARSKRIAVELHAIVAPLYDALRLAEDLAVLDQVSGGRLLVVIVGGYLPSEFAMFGKSMKQRVPLVEETFATLKAAWTGEPFRYRDRTVRVTPRPVRPQGPPLLMGGSVPAATKRAAHLAEGFITHMPELHQVYADEAKSLGKKPAPWEKCSPSFVHVTENPARDWEIIAPHAMHEMNSYGQWAAEAGTDSGYFQVKTIDELKATGGYAVVTPDEAVAMAHTHDQMLLHPLLAGLDPAMGWNSLKLFVDKVLPRI